MPWRVQEIDPGMVFHVTPIGDLREHSDDNLGRCWCNPRILDEGDRTIIVHSSMDRREEYEEGRKLS